MMIRDATRFSFRVPRPGCHKEKRILIITEGPEEFPFIEPVLRRTLYTLKFYGPDAGGVVGHDLLVQEATGGCGGDDGSNLETTRPFNTRLLLLGVNADTPANRKINLHVGHSALQACYHCWQLGQSVPPVCFPGYIDPAPTGCPVALRSAYPELFGGVPSRGRGCKRSRSRVRLPTLLSVSFAPRHLSERVLNACFIILAAEQQRARVDTFMQLMAAASNVTAKKAIVKSFGLHGESAFMTHLGHYLDPLCYQIIPVCHGTLYGVLKQFFSVTLQKINGRPEDSLPSWIFKSAQREILQHRVKMLILSNDFSRPYRDVVSKRGYWVMEDYLNFLEISVFVLSDYRGESVWPCTQLREAWMFLRAALSHYMRYEPGSMTVERRLEAADALYRFSMAWEGLVGARGCSYNLHMLNCGLFDQETARGHVALEKEFWVEECVQVNAESHSPLHYSPQHFLACGQIVKKGVKYRIGGSGEQTVVGDLLSDKVLARLATEPEVRSWERDLAPGTPRRKAGGGGQQQQQQPGPGTIRDDETSHDDGYFLGSGALLSSLTSRWVNEGLAATEHLGEDDMEVVAFDRARCKDGIVFHSLQHRRPRSRQSFFALCTATVSDAAAASTFVVRIRRFVLFRSKAPGASLGGVVRGAEVELYSCSETAPSLFAAPELDSPADLCLAMVPLSCLTHKLIHCREAQRDGKMLHLFIRYSRSIGGNLAHEDADEALTDSDEDAE